jgi:UDP-glucuronate 4-epimerase
MDAGFAGQGGPAVTGPVLVTGGAGFIGSHLIERLAGRGQPVVCLDNFDSYYSPELKRDNIEKAIGSGLVQLEEADICDRDAVQALFRSRRFASVVHLAARPGVRPSLNDPDPYLRINVGGTLNVLKAAVESGVERIVFASSSSVYGSVTRRAREDRDQPRPLSPYAASKVAGEALSHAYAASSGITTVVLRFFTVYGPRQRPDMAVNRFTSAIWNGQPITVFGDGTSQRDYTFIDDIIDGLDSAITAPLGPYSVFNLGGSRPVQLLALIGLLEERLGKKATLEFQPAGAGEPELTFADVSAAEHSLGFRPRVGIEEGTKKYVNWYLENQRALAKSH